MLERDFSATYVVPALLEIFGGVAQVEVIKHCDTFTKGIPDLTVTTDGVTYWLESKVLRDADLVDTIKRRKQKLQHDRLVRLARRSGGRAAYIVRDERINRCYWVNPLFPTVANDEHQIRQVKPMLHAMFLLKDPCLVR